MAPIISINDPSNKQIWTGIILTFVVVGLLGYNIWSGTQDRALIKNTLYTVLGNINQTEVKQNATLSQLDTNSRLLIDVITLIDDNTSANRNMTESNRAILQSLNSTYTPQFAQATKSMSETNFQMLSLLNNTFNPDYVNRTTENRENITHLLGEVNNLLIRLNQSVTDEVTGSIASTK